MSPVNARIEAPIHDGPADILIVEDDEQLAGNWQRLFAKAGHVVRHAATGEQALSMFRAGQPDLIVLDILLPDISGFDLLKTFQEGPHPRMPIIVISNLREVPDKLRGIEGGAWDWLVKPVDERELAARVQGMLRRARRLHQLEKHLQSALTNSMTDPLTGLYNRFFLQTELERNIKIAARYQRTFCLLFADVDHFKQINDTWGHLAGDAILRELAHLMRSSLRGSDSVIRYGGEEFVFILPEATIKDAGTLAEKLRRQVEKYAFPGAGNTVTISIGVTAWARGDDATEILARADQALYRAKQSGRNRVVLLPA